MENKKREQAKMIRLIGAITGAIDSKMELQKKVLESYENKSGLNPNINELKTKYHESLKNKV